MKIVFPDRIDLSPAYADKFKDMGVVAYDDTPSDATEIASRIKDAELITACYVDITRAIIDAAPKLKFIISAAVGYEWIDYKYAAEKGIKVINCPTFNSLAVAEHAIGLLFSVVRRIPKANQDFKSGKWQPMGFMGTELNGKTLGLIGHGNIGRNIDRMAAGLGMNVDFVNSRSSPGEIDSLLAKSDIVCVCAQLNDVTRHLLDARRLKMIARDAYLINVSRGAIIDQSALIQLVKNGHFAGVGLDVFEGEPLTGSVSDEIKELVNLPGVVATPHMAFNTKEAAARLGQELYANIQACVSGQPTNVIN